MILDFRIKIIHSTIHARTSFRVPDHSLSQKRGLCYESELSLTSLACIKCSKSNFWRSFRAVRDFIMSSEIYGRLYALVSMHTHGQLWILPYNYQKRTYPQDIKDLVSLQVIQTSTYFTRVGLATRTTSYSNPCRLTDRY